jgi:hypothetical protein
MIFYVNKKMSLTITKKFLEMNVDQDIQSRKIRHLSNCVYWTYLFKSI